MQPTSEQLGRFWKWCGFEFQPKTDDLRFGKPQDRWAIVDHWVYAGKKFKVLPRLSVDSLFRYAIPEMRRVAIVWQGEVQNGYIAYKYHVEAETSDCWAEATNFDPALALFWAIWQVIEQEA